MARAGIPVVNHRFIPAEDKSLAAADACCIDTLTVLLQLGAVFTLLPPEQQTLWGLFVERFSCGRNFLLLLITLMMPPLISRPPFKQPISSVITHRSATYRFRKDTLSCLFGFLLFFLSLSPPSLFYLFYPSGLLLREELLSLWFPGSSTLMSRFQVFFTMPTPTVFLALKQN